MPSRVARYVYVAIGLLFVGLGTLGVVLPVVPTTPFLLISLWAFARSSQRLEAWLLAHRLFGPRLVEWKKHRVIPWSVKLTAWGSMIASLTLMIVTGRSPIAIIGAAAVMAIGATYVASKPSKPPPESVALGPERVEGGP
ncbi:MAG TPA: YbaN family protein [Kofleriaceae bacterium]